MPEGKQGPVFNFLLTAFLNMLDDTLNLYSPVFTKSKHKQPVWISSHLLRLPDSGLSHHFDELDSKRADDFLFYIRNYASTL